MGHNLIVPEEKEFHCDLEQGASQLSTYNNKLEIHIDLRSFKRENVRVCMAQYGVINVSVLSATRKEDTDVYYDEDIVIPAHEMGFWNGFTTHMNKNGILRISCQPGIPSQQLPPPSGSAASISRKILTERIVEETQSSETSQGAEEKTETTSKTSMLPTKVKIQKGRVKMQSVKSGNQVEEAGQAKQDIFVVKPLDSDFECDITLIQDRPDFRVTADKTWRTFVNCSRHKPEDLKIEVLQNSIVRVTKKDEEPGGLFTRPFLQEIRIPPGCKAGDIEVTFNNRGILRLIAETEESREEAKRVIAIPTPPKLTMIKANIETSSSSTRTKATVGTPWGQRVATKTTTSTTQLVEPGSNEKFEASIVAKEYEPDEIDIKISEGWITIIGKKKTSAFGENTFRSKTFTKKIQIPDKVNPESITCGQDVATGLIHISTQQ